MEHNDSLLKMLKEKNDLHQHRFHVPGHKGSFPGCDFLSAAAPYDYTELPDTDSLFEANGILLSVEKQVAALYGSAASFLSCGGATLCIQTMLALCAKEGDTIILARGCHGSAIHSLVLLGLSPVWIWPHGKNGLPGQVTPEDIEKAIQEFPDSKAVYITSPNYFGEMADLKAIGRICKKSKIPLLVDNAHGAHFPFVNAVHPLEAGATMCADSAHKTLPTLTGSAFLHCGTSVNREDVKETMRLFGSTSPSYLLMSSMDYAVQYLQKDGKEDYRNLEKKVAYIIRKAKQKGYVFPEGEIDPIRITLSARELGYDGEDFSNYLLAHKIEVELHAGDYVILISTPFNKEEDFYALEKALDEIPVKIKTPPKDALPLPIPKKKMEPRGAMFSTKEEVAVENAVGRISASTFAPCPPGIPLVIPGEEIDAETAKILKAYGILRIKVVE